MRKLVLLLCVVALVAAVTPASATPAEKPDKLTGQVTFSEGSAILDIEGAVGVAGAPGYAPAHGTAIVTIDGLTRVYDVTSAVFGYGTTSGKPAAIVNCVSGDGVAMRIRAEDGGSPGPGNDFLAFAWGMRTMSVTILSGNLNIRLR